MANPRKKLPTGPTKDDLLSRLGSALRRQPAPSPDSDEGSDQPPSLSDSDQESESPNPAEPSPADPLGSNPAAESPGTDEGAPLFPENDREVEQTIEDLLENSGQDDSQDDKEPPSDDTDVPLPPGPDDLAFWLESAGSAEAADLMAAMEQIESEEAQQRLSSEASDRPIPTSQVPPIPNQVELMLDDLLSALQMDEEDTFPHCPVETEPITSHRERRHDPTETQGVDSNNAHSFTGYSDAEQTQPVTSDPQIPHPSDQSKPGAFGEHENAECLPPTEPMTLELSIEATRSLHQIRTDYGVPAEILVDVILRNWSDLPNWAKQKHLGLAHQTQVERLLAGQQRTIQSIERLLCNNRIDNAPTQT